MNNVGIIVRNHPFETGTFNEIPHGYTIQQIVHMHANPKYWDKLIVDVDGTQIPREYWHRVKPKPGRKIMILERKPHGRDIFVIIGAIIITAAAFYVAGPEGALMSSSAFTTTFGTSSAFVAGLVGAGIATAGALLLNSLFPPEIPEDERKRKPYRVEGSRNSYNKYGAWPVVLGKPRFAPLLAAEPINIENGKNTDEMLLLFWGYGKLNITDLKVGETPIDEFGDVTIINHDGSSTTVNLQKYTNDVHRELVNTEITYDGGPVTRRTQTGTTKIDIVISFPKGLIGYGRKTGDELDQKVQFKVETSPADLDTWTDHGTYTVEAKTQSLVTKVITIDNLTAGQYDVRVTRLSMNKNSSRFFDQSMFFELRSYNPNPPVNAAYAALTELYIKASEKTTGTLDRITGIAERICLDWDRNTSTWIERATNNPASLARWILQGPAIKSPVPDSRLDLTEWQNWAEYCEDNGFTCNYVEQNFTTTKQLLNLVANCGRAKIISYKGIYKPVIEQPRSVVVQMFSEENVSNFSANLIYFERPHAFRVRFVNQENSWKDDEIIVYADGYDETNATRFEELPLEGITDPEQAWKFGRFRLGEIYLRRERYSFETDWEGLVAQYGDLVHIAHRRISVGTYTGRIDEIIYSGSNVIKIIAEDKVALDPAKDYIIRVRKSDGNTEDFNIVSSLEEKNEILIKTPKADNGISEGDLFVIGEKTIATIPALVANIKPGVDRTKIECIPYDEKLYNSDSGSLPTFTSRASTLPGDEYPIIADVRGDGGVFVSNTTGTMLSRIAITLYTASTRASNIDAVEIRWKKEDDQEPWSSKTVSRDTIVDFIEGVEVGSTYIIQARYKLINSTYSIWSGPVTHTVGGDWITPPDVNSIWVDGNSIVWSDVNDPFVVGYRLAFNKIAGRPFSEATRIGPAIIGNTVMAVSSIPADVGEVLVVAVTSVGTISENPARLSWPPVFNDDYIYYKKTTYSHSDNNWPGDMIDAYLVNNELVPGTDEAAFPNLNGAAWPDPDAAAFDVDMKEGTYIFKIDKSLFTLSYDLINTDRFYVDITSTGLTDALYVKGDIPKNINAFSDGKRLSDAKLFVSEDTDAWLPLPRRVSLDDPSTEYLTVKLLTENIVSEITVGLELRVFRILKTITTNTYGEYEEKLPTGSREVTYISATAIDGTSPTIAYDITTDSVTGEITAKVTTKDSSGNLVSTNMILLVEYA